MERIAPKSYLPELTCNVGDTIVVPVTTDGYEEIYAITLTVRFNEFYLKYVGCEVADEFNVGEISPMLTNVTPMLNSEIKTMMKFQAAWFRNTPAAQVPGETIFYLKFKAVNPGIGNLVWINKSLKDLTATCEWGRFEWDPEHTKIIDMYALDEPDGTYNNGKIEILEA